MARIECILLIDDDTATNIYHSIVLDRLKITDHLQICTDGIDALDYIAGKGAYQDKDLPQPRLIFLDVSMPGMDGFEFLEHYEAKYQNKIDRPILVMLTTSLSERDEVRAESYSSISRFMNKPLSGSLLDEILAEFF